LLSLEELLRVGRPGGASSTPAFEWSATIRFLKDLTSAELFPPDASQPQALFQYLDLQFCILQLVPISLQRQELLAHRGRQWCGEFALQLFEKFVEGKIICQILLLVFINVLGEDGKQNLALRDFRE
jgi:hypothetical protein